ncbi:hypothetical protein PoB_005366700 [Plakobranchus ocellatus]|uniref:Uncharacterized protein n=1 Tax=Plakobranchus ocellatus TaxID=259542 RepID=A0AAV4C6E8_9GAST|nr:hypothetical protein PoB_005366700 [Plakobranchus ocellatus]
MSEDTFNDILVKKEPRKSKSFVTGRGMPRNDALDRKCDKASVLSVRRKTFVHIIYRACPRALAFIASKRSFCAQLNAVESFPRLAVLKIATTCRRAVAMRVGLVSHTVILQNQHTRATAAVCKGWAND